MRILNFLFFVLPLSALTANAQEKITELPADTAPKVVFHMQFEPGTCTEYHYKEVECFSDNGDTLSIDSIETRFRLDVLQADSVSALLSYHLLTRDDTDTGVESIQRIIRTAIAGAIQWNEILIRVTEGGTVRRVENLPQLAANVREALNIASYKVYDLIQAEVESINATAGEDEQEEMPSHHDVKNALVDFANTLDDEDVLSRLEGMEQVFELAGISPQLGDDIRSNANDDEYTTVSVSLAEKALPDNGSTGYAFHIEMMRLSFIGDDEEGESADATGTLPEEESEDGEKGGDLRPAFITPESADSTAIPSSNRMLSVSNNETDALLDSHFLPISTTTQNNISTGNSYMTRRITLTRIFTSTYEEKP